MKKSEKVELLLSNIDDKELKEFIRKECENDKQLRDRFLAVGLGSLFKPKESDYKSRIKALLRQYGGLHMYIDYYRMGEFSSEIWQILNEAEKAISDKNRELALVIISAISDCADDILYCGDDSGGEIGDIFQQCFELLLQLSKEPLPSKIRNKLYALAVERFENKHLEDWSWWWDWMEIAINCADTSEQRHQLENLLNGIINISNSDDWFENRKKRQARNMMSHLIAKFGTHEETVAYMYSHINNPDFRRRLLQMAWDSGDMKELQRLADEGIKADAKLSGLVKEWQGWKLKGFVRTKDKDNALPLAVNFFFDQVPNGEEFTREKMYGIMKYFVLPEKWEEWIENLLSQSKSNQQMLFIFTEEKMWDRYMDYLRSNPSTFEIENAPEEVIELNRDEVIKLYRSVVGKYFGEAKDRKGYKYGIRLLKKLQALGGKQEAIEIVEELRRKYPRRPALLDELASFTL